MAITYPDNGALGVAAGAGSSTTATLSATLTAGVQKLIVSVIGRQTISGVTYNGVAMTLIQASTLQYGYNYHSVYFLDDPLTGSAANIVATYSSASTDRDITYVSVAGTGGAIGASVVPVNGKTDGSQISTNITTTAANSDIIESSYCNNTLTVNTLGAGQSLLIGIPGTSTSASIDKRSVTTAGAYTVTIDPNGTPNQDVIVFELKVATTYSLAIGNGSYSLTGNAVSLLFKRLMSMGTGAYNLVGKDLFFGTIRNLAKNVSTWLNRDKNI